jgi:hypothetical protein
VTEGRKMELTWESQLCSTMNYAQNKKHNGAKTQFNESKKKKKTSF